jgi:hypothetical protein
LVLQLVLHLVQVEQILVVEVVEEVIIMEMVELADQE